MTVDELTEITQDDLRRIELYALPILLLLSLLVFRGLVAALLPVVVGGLSILTSLALLNVLTAVMEIDAFAINIVTGLGLGLAIDYSLFLVTRFREELEGTDSTEKALVETTAAIGPMIAFSGVTVALSLISLWVFPQRFLYSIGIGGALVALTSALVCMVLLPAVLGLLGERVNALSLRPVPGSSQHPSLAPAGALRAALPGRGHPGRGDSDGRGRPAVPPCGADPGERQDPSRDLQRPAGR